MERLTKRTEQGDAYIPECFGRCEGEGPSEKCRECDIEHNLIYSLAAYEDTDLTPEQISILDKLFLAKCEEVNQLRAEMERLKGKSSGAQGDLISREETLKAVSDAVENLVEEAFYSTLSIPELRETIEKSINEQPTAYDVEKVVEQLEYHREEFDRHDIVPLVNMDYAVAVVRAGGKE